MEPITNFDYVHPDFLQTQCVVHPSIHADTQQQNAEHIYFHTYTYIPNPSFSRARARLFHSPSSWQTSWLKRTSAATSVIDDRCIDVRA